MNDNRVCIIDRSSLRSMTQRSTESTRLHGSGNGETWTENIRDSDHGLNGDPVTKCTWEPERDGRHGKCINWWRGRSTWYRSSGTWKGSENESRFGERTRRHGRTPGR
jgi:hypothetical protein